MPATACGLLLVSLAGCASLTGSHMQPAASSKRTPLLKAFASAQPTSEDAPASTRPSVMNGDAIDTALMVASGNRRYQNTLDLAAGLLFGSTAAAWITPLLLDAPMAAAIGFSKSELISASSAVFAGWASGCAILSPLSDKIGRKPIIRWSGVFLAAGLALPAGIGLLPSPALLAFPALLAARAFAGFGVGGLMAQAFALALESSEGARSKSGGMKINLYYCLAVCLLAAYHFFVASPAWLGLGWQVEITALAAIIAGSALTVGLVAEESPPYLMAMGRLDEAEAAIRRIASTNGVESREAGDTFRRLATTRMADESQARPAQSESEGGWAMAEQKEASPPSLWQPSTLTMSACVMAAFFAATAAWFVLNLSAGSLSDSVLLNLVLLNLVDVPAYTAAGWLAERYGTRQVARGGFIAGSLVLLSLAAAVGHAPQAAITTLALVGKVCISGAFGLMWVLPVEVYPANLRGAALGFANVFGRAGAILAPIITGALPLSSSAAVCSVIAIGGAAALSIMDRSASHESGEGRRSDLV